MPKLLLLVLAFLPLTLALACSSEDKAAVGTTVAGVLTPAGTQIAGAQTAVSGAAGTIQAGAGTAVAGAATQVSGAAGTVQAGAGTAVTGAATQVTGAATARAGSGAPISLPIANADQARDALLNAAKNADWSKTGNVQDLSNYPAWQNLASALQLAGAAAAASPNMVSVYRDTVTPGQPASASNPNLIAFTVSDASGNCAAGAIKGYPNFTSYESMQIQGQPCTAQSVVDAVKSGATGTPTP